MTDAEIMETEMKRVRDFLGQAVADLEADEGDLRFFSAAFLTAAIQLHVDIEGVEGLKRAIARLAAREMVRSGEAGRC
ncbi:hypothetical protein OEZ71_04695 [Defluviimonas sp. WL0050]|uniref:Uncharacterized protein n=1 Tax=Albidovulum litorale TaxID=2984134 RepID=A0ABT2ZKE0_9RHOB|nr:hypothetical protein [Defluviimonas sp. WL0050]MCV2871588.1 hypothetical protein [Defluviimonas sp. WL0050]